MIAVDMREERSRLRRWMTVTEREGEQQMTFNEQEKEITRVCGTFPAEFGLQAFPGMRFKLNRQDCYWNDGPVLYVHVKRDGKWLSFAKGTSSDLQKEMTK